MGQIIGLDSSILIYHIEDNVEFADTTEKVLDAIKKGEKSGVMSVVGMIEILTGPKRAGKHEMVPRYKELIRAIPHLTVAGITERIVDGASDLRAKYHLRTPDAIHVATAIDFGADEFITNDEVLKQIKEIKVTLLSSL